MKILSSLLCCLPVIGFSQSLPTSLEVQMFNSDRVVVSLDGKQFGASSKFKMSGLSSGNHQLQVYKPKQYINPSTNAISERLVPIYSGNIFLAEKQSTNCTINEFHEKVIILKSR